MLFSPSAGIPFAAGLSQFRWSQAARKIERCPPLSEVGADAVERTCPGYPLHLASAAQGRPIAVQTRVLAAPNRAIFEAIL